MSITYELTSSKPYIMGDTGSEPNERGSVDTVLDLNNGLLEEKGPPPECAVDGCHRDGSTPKKMPVSGVDGEATDQYVCHYHRLLFLGVRALVLAVVIVIFLIAYFQI